MAELPPEERKKKLEELKRRVRDLRLRCERWGMLKISDVSELNAVYRELGEIYRELAKLNPDPEAVRLKNEVLLLMSRIPFSIHSLRRW